MHCPAGTITDMKVPQQYRLATAIAVLRPELQETGTDRYGTGYRAICISRNKEIVNT